eukprot:scaffold2657_cov155-Skeletonema_marinoi.AAC.10
MDFSQIAFVSTAVKIIAFTPKSLFAALQELVPHISTWGCSTHLHESCKLQVQFSHSEREARLASHLNVGRACARVGCTKLDSISSDRFCPSLKHAAGILSEACLLPLPTLQFLT